MTIGARIIVTSFSSSSSPKLTPWSAHSTRVAGVLAAPGTASSGTPAVWHLASPNHRMLARSIAIYDAPDDAVDAAARILARRDELVPVLVRERGGATLGWFLRLDDAAEIGCARWYSTDRDRRNALASAIDALGAADIAPVRASHPSLGRPERV